MGAELGNDEKSNGPLFTCAPYKMADIVFGGVCLSVRLSVRTKSRKLLVGNCCNLVEMCFTVNARSVWKLVTFEVGDTFSEYVR